MAITTRQKLAQQEIVLRRLTDLAWATGKMTTAACGAGALILVRWARTREAQR